MLVFTRFALLLGLLISIDQTSGIASANEINPESPITAQPNKLEGLPYLNARKIILQFGWKPFVGACEGAGTTNQLCSLYPEIGNCSGSGIGLCDMSFYRRNRCLVVVAIGGAPGDRSSGDSVVRDVTFRRRPCERQAASNTVQYPNLSLASAGASTEGSYTACDRNAEKLPIPSAR